MRALRSPRSPHFSLSAPSQRSPERSRREHEALMPSFPARSAFFLRNESLSPPAPKAHAMPSAMPAQSLPPGAREPPVGGQDFPAHKARLTEGKDAAPERAPPGTHAAGVLVTQYSWERRILSLCLPPDAAAARSNGRLLPVSSAPRGSAPVCDITRSSPPGPMESLPRALRAPLSAAIHCEGPRSSALQPPGVPLLAL